MARRATANPRQIRSKSCGCAACMADYPPAEHGERKKRRDCIGSWQARYRDAAGKQKARNFKKHRDATDFLDQVRTEVRSGTYLDPARGKITLADWWALWWPAHTPTRISTRNHKLSQWRTHIEPQWGTTPLIALAHHDIQAWITSGVKGWSTQTKVIQLLSGILRDAMLDRRIPFNPVDGVRATAQKPAKHPDDLRPPTPAQYALIREKMDPHFRPLLDFAEETGMRWGEIAGLRWWCVDRDAGTVTVREVIVHDNGKLVRQAVPKTEAGFRTVPLTEKALAALGATEDVWKSSRSTARSTPQDGMRPKELCFRGPRGAALHKDNFRRFWLPAIENAGVARKIVSPETGRTEWWPRVHDYRHALASRLHAAGVSEKDVQIMLGQERGGRVTWLYTHHTEESMGTVRTALESGRALRAVS